MDLLGVGQIAWLNRGDISCQIQPRVRMIATDVNVKVSDTIDLVFVDPIFQVDDSFFFNPTGNGVDLTEESSLLAVFCLDGIDILVDVAAIVVNAVFHFHHFANVVFAEDFVADDFDVADLVSRAFRDLVVNFDTRLVFGEFQMFFHVDIEVPQHVVILLHAFDIIFDRRRVVFCRQNTHRI